MSDVHADLTAWLDMPEAFTPEDAQNMACALREVLAMHEPRLCCPNGCTLAPGRCENILLCDGCTRRAQDTREYPCEHVKAIAAELGVTETRQETNR